MTRRRDFLAASAAVMGAGALSKPAHANTLALARVFVGKAETYSSDLQRLIRDGLVEIRFDEARVKGKTVLLKPNLVEPSRSAPHINTHPLVVQAAAAVFRSWGAAEVLVAEGQGHIRDTALVLEQSGLEPVVRDGKLEFVDLNHDDVFSKPNALGVTGLKELYLPVTLKRADVIVSMPKMKLHHWAGVTLAMKNFFGLMPGICYGWPKNVLHVCGIPNSILDINATVRADLAIVDGVVGMEGDGPIMGTPRQAGLLVIGDNSAAVDATCARLMAVDPRNIDYLSADVTRKIGPTAERSIEQRGEALAGMVTPFRYPAHPHFRAFERFK